MSRKRISGLLASIFLLSAAAAHAAAADYETLVARAKNGALSIDYDALRQAYVQSPAYDPYGAKISALRKAMLAAKAMGDCTGAQAHAQEIIAVSFINIEAHLISSLCYGGAASAASPGEKEDAIAEGLMLSILKSGDGFNTGTAFEIVTLAEEYDVFQVLQLTPGSQALIQENGHAYDRFDVTDRQSGKKSVVFFKLDAVLGAFERELKARTK